MRKSYSWSLLAAAPLFSASLAFAQTNDPPPDNTNNNTNSRPVAVTTTVVSTPGATKIVTNSEDVSDHSKVVGRFGFGFMGISRIDIAPLAGVDHLDAPAIGMRYWLNETIGIDAGLGLAMASGSTETVTGGASVAVDKPGFFGFALHGGVPLALANSKHFSFQVTPELKIAYATGTQKTNVPNGDDTTSSGFRLSVGARVGAEIHFGFIGIPQLALQGSVGLYVNRASIKTTTGNNSASSGTTTLGTSVQNDPWAIFANNVSAIYYF